jgi:hypothetical protein
MPIAVEDIRMAGLGQFFQQGECDSMKHGKDGETVYCAIPVSGTVCQEATSPRSLIFVEGIPQQITLVEGCDRPMKMAAFRMCLCIPASGYVLYPKCLQFLNSLVFVTLECQSTLSRIETRAFLNSSAISSICIPLSVEILSGECLAEFICLTFGPNRSGRSLPV